MKFLRTIHAATHHCQRLVEQVAARPSTGSGYKELK